MKTTYKFHRSSSKRRQRGFTLLEALIAVTIVSMIFLGAINLFIAATKTTLKASSTMFANLDATQAILHVIDKTREAQSFALPLENTFVVPTGFSASGFYTTDGTEAINTAIELNSPATLLPSDVGYLPSDPAQVSVVLTSGANSTVSPTLYNHDGASTSTILIYRGDSDGTADASSGTYLWEYNVQAATSTAICKTIAPVANAVQFVRPTTNPSTNTGSPEPFEVEVKIISSYYSMVGGQVTNEETNGRTVSQLSGKCVYMRDHITTPTTPANANTSATNNAFKFH